MLIALIGAPGAGKDTIAKRLVDKHGFTRFAFADKVRELAYEFLPPHERSHIDRIGWDRAKKSETFRKTLEWVGDGARKVFGEEFWIEQIREQVKDVSKKGGDVVITDVRKRNEASFVGGFDLHIFGGSCIWHVHRPGCERRPFDQWREEWAAFSIPNNGEIGDLHKHVDELLDLCR